MRKTLVVGATFVVLAAVAGLGAAYASQNDHMTIRLRVNDTIYHELDLGETGSSPGDQSIWTGDLFDSSGQHRVGHTAGQSIATTPIAFDPPSGQMLSRAVYVLEHGQILNAGLVQAADLSPGDEFSVAVVGGTGDYRDAAGEMIIKILSGEEEFDFEVTIHLE